MWPKIRPAWRSTWSPSRPSKYRKTSLRVTTATPATPNQPARLTTPSGGCASSAAALLRLVADLDTLEGKWPVSPEDRAALGAIRGSASAFIGIGIDNAVRGEILTHLERLAHPDKLDDEGVERLEETARNTRRLGIAGAKLGLAASADALLERFLPTIQQAIRRRPPGSSMQAGLFDQVRTV